MNDCNFPAFNVIISKKRTTISKMLFMIYQKKNLKFDDIFFFLLTIYFLITCRRLIKQRKNSNKNLKNNKILQRL